MKIYIPSIAVYRKKHFPINLKTMSPLKNGQKIAFICDVGDYRFSNEMSDAAFSEFHYYCSKLYDQFKTLLEASDETKIIIMFYEKRVSKEKLNYLSTPNLAIITDEGELVRKVFSDSVMYKVFPVFYLPQAEFAIIPTDHLDIFIASTKNKNYSDVIDSQQFDVTEWTNDN